MKDASLYIKVISIRDILSSALSTDLTKLGKRNIWGYRISMILQRKAAQCGETTRILINILHKINVPARRVTLYAQGTMHSVVEARIGNQWIIIDTNHGPEGFREYSTAQPSSIDDHFKTAKTPRHQIYADEGMQKFGFHTYSYAFNFNKVTFRFFGILVFIQKPFPLFLFYLLENPPLILSLFILVIIIIWGIVLAINLKRKKGRGNENSE